MEVIDTLALVIQPPPHPSRRMGLCGVSGTFRSNLKPLLSIPPGGQRLAAPVDEEEQGEDSLGSAVGLRAAFTGVVGVGGVFIIE